MLVCFCFVLFFVWVVWFFCLFLLFCLVVVVVFIVCSLFGLSFFLLFFIFLFFFFFFLVSFFLFFFFFSFFLFFLFFSLLFVFVVHIETSVLFCLLLLDSPSLSSLLFLFSLIQTINLFCFFPFNFSIPSHHPFHRKQKPHRASKKKKGAISWQKKRQFFIKNREPFFQFDLIVKWPLNFLMASFLKSLPSPQWWSTISTNGLNLYFSV